MKLFIGADHRGFGLKEELKPWMIEHAPGGVDVGAFQLTPGDDYVDYASDVAKRISQIIENGHTDAAGIVFCGSGVGVDISANKIKGIRCGLGFSEEQVRAAKADDNINMLAIPADYVDSEKAKRMIQAFLETPFKHEEKYERRIEKIEELEK